MPIAIETPNVGLTPDAEPLPSSMAAAPTLDLRVAWNSLSEDLRAELGMAAIAMGVARLVTMIEEHELPDWRIAAQASHTNYYDAADQEAASIMGVIVEANVFGGDIRRLRPPDLGTLNVRQCVGCGCTDRCACAGGCRWVGPRLCSSCGPEDSGRG